MPPLCAGGHLDSSLPASSRGCTHNGATDAVMPSEFNTDSELRATKLPSEV
jgi:hypothetical protein